MKQFSLIDYYGCDLRHIEFNFDMKSHKLICILLPNCITKELVDELYILHCRIGISSHYKKYFKAIEWQAKNPHLFISGLDLSFIHENLKSHREITVEEYLLKLSDVFLMNNKLYEVGIKTCAVCKGLTSRTGLNFALSSSQITASHVKFMVGNDMFHDVSQFSIISDDDLSKINTTISQQFHTNIDTSKLSANVRYDRNIYDAVDRKMGVYGRLSNSDLGKIEKFIQAHRKIYGS